MRAMREDIRFMDRELPIERSVHDMMVYAYQTPLKQFPKTEKFGMVSDIKKCMHDLVWNLEELKRHYQKKTTLRELDVAVNVLKKYVRLAYDLKFIAPKHYDIWSGKIGEIGKQVGGMVKEVYGSGSTDQNPGV